LIEESGNLSLRKDLYNSIGKVIWYAFFEIPKEIVMKKFFLISTFFLVVASGCQNPVSKMPKTPPIEEVSRMTIELLEDVFEATPGESFKDIQKRFLGGTHKEELQFFIDELFDEIFGGDFEDLFNEFLVGVPEDFFDGVLNDVPDETVEEILNSIYEKIPADDPDGIVENAETGLIAGFNLNDNLLLDNEGVSEVGEITFEENGLNGPSFKSNIDENNIGSFILVEDEVLPEITQSGSLETWIKPTENNYWTGIIHKGQEADFSDESWSLQFRNDLKLLFFVYRENVDENGNKPYFFVYSVTPLTANEWCHVSITWELLEDGSMVFKLYLNGELDTETTDDRAVGPIYNSDGGMIIGAQIESSWGSYGNFAFDGLIDEVYIYDVVRTEDEIRADYELYE
jgi:hypothetical protein